MPTITRVRCPKGHESEYGRVYIDMGTGLFRYMCLECKQNYDGMIFIEGFKPKEGQIPINKKEKKEEEVKPAIIQKRGEEEEKREEEKREGGGEGGEEVKENATTGRGEVPSK